LHHDELFHSSLVSAIQVHGVASTLLDGVVPISYHVGSHQLWAALVSLSGLPTLRILPIAVPIVLGGLLVSAFGYLTETIRQQVAPQVALVPSAVASVCALVLLGIVPNEWASAVGVSYVNAIVSASNAFSLVLAFSALAMLAVAQRHVVVFATTRVAVLLVASISVLWCVYAKVSVGFVLLAVIGWLWLRTKSWRSLGLTAGFLCVAALGARVALLATYRTAAGEAIFLAPSAIALSFVGAIRNFQFLLAYGASAMAVYVLLGMRVRTEESDVAVAMECKRDQLLIAELLCIAVLGGLLPAFMINTLGNGAYFMDPQRWGAAAILSVLGSVYMVPGRLRQAAANRRLLVLLGFFSAPLVASAASNVARPTVRAIRTAGESRSGLAAGASPRQELFGILDSLARLSPTTREARTLFFKDEVLELLALPNAPCWAPALVSGAVTGVARFGAVPISDSCKAVGFGFEAYPIARQRAGGETPQCPALVDAAHRLVVITMAKNASALRVRESRCIDSALH
jgi:hypothetical protein